jgi:hypothetical protein
LPALRAEHFRYPVLGEVEEVTGCAVQENVPVLASTLPKQAFLDGNKRTRARRDTDVAEANGYRIDAADPELAAWIIALSSDQTPVQLAEQIRQRLIPATSHQT